MNASGFSYNRLAFIVLVALAFAFFVIYKTSQLNENFYSSPPESTCEASVRAAAAAAIAAGASPAEALAAAQSASKDNSMKVAADAAVNVSQKESKAAVDYQRSTSATMGAGAAGGSAAGGAAAGATAGSMGAAAPGSTKKTNCAKPVKCSK